MTQQELSQAAIFARLKEGRLTRTEAATVLGLSVRQVDRKLKAYRSRGPAALAHGLRGRAGNRTGDPVLVGCALGLVAEHYPDFGPTFAAEKLAENHKLTVHPETLRLAMAAAGLWQPGKRRVTHRAWRERRAHPGELVQLDGSTHRWFEGRAGPCTLLAFIDDATSEVLGMSFATSESTEAVFRASYLYFTRTGVPASLYVDRGGVFKVNVNNPDDERITQYRRAVEELGVTMTYARSPQAKGRVERLFGTLQDRLVKELRLQGIGTTEEANRFLEGYRLRHNRRFAVSPASPENLHRAVTREALAAALCWKEERVLTGDFTIRYQNRWLQLGQVQPTILRPGERITVSRSLEGSLGLSIRRVSLRFTEIAKPAKQPVQARLQLRKPYTPPARHPWRRQPLTTP